MVLKTHLVYLAILFSLASIAQPAKSFANKGRRGILLNYYPSALVVKNISIGLEKALNQKFIFETSLAWHCLTKANDFYRQGGRVDVLPKYALLTKSNFECTAVSDLYYLQYFSRDTWFPEQVILPDLNKSAPDPLYRTKENKSWSTFGMGLGIGFRYCISKHFSICNENFLTYSKTTRKQTITQIEYLSSYLYPFSFAPALGTDTQHFSPRFGLRGTIKLSYSLCN